MNAKALHTWQFTMLHLAEPRGTRGCIESEATHLAVLGIKPRIWVGVRGKKYRLIGQDRQAGAGVSSEEVWDRLVELVREQAQTSTQRVLGEKVREFLGRRQSEQRAEVDGVVSYRNGYGTRRRLAMSSGTNAATTRHVAKPVCHKGCRSSP